MPDSSARVFETVATTNEVQAAGDRGRFCLRIASDLAGPAAVLADPAETALPAHGHEPFWADESCHMALHNAGLDRFDSIMQADQGRCMRALAKRENWQLELDFCGRSRRMYLKKHRVRSWGTRLRAWLGLEAGDSAGREEAKNVGRLQAAGIPCMELAAYGERLRDDGLLESFLLTPELDGFTQLDDFLRTRFGALDTIRSRQRDPDLLRLTTRVATIARQFHEAGFNHRDLYCCHFFVRESSPGDFEIRLIDLQRVQHRRRFRRRWLVKDLAQLAYSAPRDRIKCTQKLAFIRQYFGVRKLRAEHKRLIREVLAKQQAMEHKQGLIA